MEGLRSPSFAHEKKLLSISRQSWGSASLWIVVFLLLNIFLPQNGGDDRLQVMLSMAEDFTFELPSLSTNDWAQNAAGKYYSTKAPGPMLIGFPLYAAVDGLLTWSGETKEERMQIREQHASLYRWIMSLFLQAFPFAVITFLCLRFLRSTGVSEVGMHIAALSILFGNTAALYMNMYFGHGMTAMFLLATMLTLLKRKYLLSGVLYGSASLCDYGAILLAPLFLLALLTQERHLRTRTFLKAAGGVLPLVMLLLWYHSVLFGDPFTITLQHQNPIFLFMKPTPPYLIPGILSLFPSMNILWEILVGPSRGILMTQPWVLTIYISAVIILCRERFLKRKKDIQPLHTLLTVLLPGLFLLCWMNASYSVWNGGVLLGPRFLSPIFPLFGLAAGMLYGTLSTPIKITLWITLVPSILLSMLVYATGIFVGYDALWPHFFQVLSSHPKETLPRLFIACALFLSSLTVSIFYPKISK